MRLRIPVAPFIAALLVLTPVHARAADPLTIGGTIAAVGTALGMVKDIVMLVNDVIRITGEYEEQLTSLKIRSYSETTDGMYRNARWYQRRTYWIDSNGDGHYRTEWLHLYPDGSRQTTVSTDAFQYCLESRDYLCEVEPGTWNRVRSRTVFTLGYEVVRPTNNSRLCAPNPMKVRLDWTGVTLPADCDGTSHGRRVITEYEAPRRAFRAVPFPMPDFEVYSVELSPRLR